MMNSRKWCTLPLPETEDEVLEMVEKLGGEEKFGEWLDKRERLIDAEIADPYRYGYELECWKAVRKDLGLAIKRDKEMVMPEPGVHVRMGLTGLRDVLVMGGNRASKTTFAAKIAVETMMRIPKSVVWCLHEDENASVERQQSLVYDMLPPELRDIGKRGKVTNVSYTAKNGFSDNKFILPNGSLCVFKNYNQYAQNAATFEGGECDMIWCDELVTSPILDTLRYRLVTRGGLMMLTFTPLEGYSTAVKQYMEGSMIGKTRRAELLKEGKRYVEGCDAGHMPTELICSKISQRVYFFHSDMNPYNDYENLKGILVDRGQDEVMCRAYGYPTKKVENAFPKIGAVHFIDAKDVPKKGTNYLVADNHGSRNWFMIWARVALDGKIFVYREFPDASIGEWAEAGEKMDGRKGPAQKDAGGKGILAYKKLILEAEGWELKEGPNGRRTWDDTFAEKIGDRFIDPRGGSNSVPGIDEGTSTVEMMLDVQLDSMGNEIGPSMMMLPAPSEGVDAGTGLINDALDYNTEEDITIFNCPRLYVSKECENVKYALMTWTGIDGEKGATKDPIDCIKMLLKAEAGYIDVKTEGCYGGGSY